MRLKQAIGFLMVAVPLVGICILIFMDLGWKLSLMILGAAIVLTGYVLLVQYLLKDD